MSVSDASTLAIDNSRVMLQFVASLTDDLRSVIYDRNVFIVHATAARNALDHQIKDLKEPKQMLEMAVLF
jgi:hypothetical protein